MKNANQTENGLRSFSLYNISFSVTNLDASVKWYSDVLGFKQVSRSNFQLPEGAAEVAIISGGGLRLELRYGPNKKRIDDLFALHVDVIGNKAIVLQVNDIAVASEELAAKNVKFVYREKYLVEGAMLSTMIEDIDGNKINIFQTDTLLETENTGQQATIIGLDHIGMNVPDINAATVFLQKAFGAKVIYESYSKQQPPLALTGVEDTLNAAKGTEIYACRMIKIGRGPDIELFQIHVERQREAVKTSDLGLQHFSVYTEHMSHAIAQFVLAGGKMLSEPNPILFPLEKGDSNLFCYGVMPWGTAVEFITYPNGMPYEENTSLRRWQGGKSSQ